MNAASSPNWPLTPAQLAALQSAQAEFESGWAAGGSPSLEPHLVDDPAVRPALLAELVLSDARHRAAAGHVPRLDEYLDRYPELADHPDVLKSVQPALKSIAGGVRPTAAGTSQGSPSDTKFAADFDASKGPLAFGRYRLEKKLGEGGMGAVFLASDSVLGRKVAIKIPFLTSKKERQEILARFHREARCAAALDHPNICGVFDVGEIDGQPYIAMAYVSGKPLSDFIRAKAEIPVKTALQLAQKLAKTLEHAHSRGVLHRDLKPSNILINDRKEPVVMDFGLARLESARETDPLTRSGDIVGTPAYMPPEQLAGKQNEMGPWSDVYSLGMLLYQVLTKQRPFNGDLFEIVHQIANENVRPPSTLRPEIEPAVDALVLKALEKDAAKRFRSMGEFASAIAVCLKSTPEAPAASDSLGSAAGAGLPPSRSAPAAKPSPLTETKPVTAAGVATPPAADPQTVTLKATDPTPSVQPSVVPSARRPAPETAISIASEAPRASKAHAAKAVPKTAAAGRRPPRKFPPFAWAAASGALLLLGVVLFLPAGKGTLRVELKDPSVEVKIKGTEIVFSGADPQEVRLTPGEKTLIVQRGDFSFETKSLTLKKNETVTAVVELLEGEVRVAAEGIEIGRGSGGQAISSPLKEANPQGEGDSAADRKYSLQFDGNGYVEIPSLTYDLSRPITIEATAILEEQMGVSCLVTNAVNKGASGVSLYRLPNPERVGFGIFGPKAFHFVEPRSINYKVVRLSGVWNGNDILLFIDGRLTHSKKYQKPVGTQEAASPFLIGGQREISGEIGYKFCGEISEVRISRTARYSNDYDPSPILEADKDTLALYRFGEGTGEVLKDSSGNGHHGKIIGAKWVSAAGTPLSSMTSWTPTPEFKAWMDGVAKMPRREQLAVVLRKLQELNPKFDGKIVHPSDPTAWAGTLHMITDNCENISPLAALRNLTALSLEGSSPGKGKLADLAPLQGLPIVFLSVINNRELNNLSPLRGMPLKTLKANNTSVRDLSALTGMPLETFHGIGSPIGDLSPLRGMPLINLEIYQTQVSDLAPLAECSRIRNLRIGSPKLSDLAPISGLRPTFFEATSSPIEDISPLKDWPLDHVGLTATNVSDLTPLRGKRLTSLTIDRSKVTDLMPLKGQFIGVLQSRGCRIDDLSPLADSGVTAVTLDFAAKRHATALRSIKTLKTINGKPAAEFLKEFDSKPAGSPQSAASPAAWPDDAPKPAIAPFDAAQAKKHQEEWAAYLKVPVEFENSVGMKFRLVPPGSYLRGAGPGDLREIAAMKARYPNDANADRAASESPRHGVAITRPFYVGVHEVTQKAFEAVMGKNPAAFSKGGSAAKGVGALDTSDFPVESVTAADAAQFCSVLSVQEKRTPSYLRVGETWGIQDAAGYRLPTEAEWEYFCRAGTTTIFWSGDRTEDVTRSDCVGDIPLRHEQRAYPVGERKANPFGLFDVHGNVRELCQDGWIPNVYATRGSGPDPATTLRNPATARGGCYIFSGFTARSAARDLASQPNPMTGFRVILPIAVDKPFAVPVPTVPAGEEVKPAEAPKPAGPTSSKTPAGDLKPSAPKPTANSPAAAVPSPPVRTVMSSWPRRIGPLAPKPPRQAAVKEAAPTTIRHFTFTPLFHYELDALVIAKKHYPQKEWNDFFPWDLGVAWGRLSDPFSLDEFDLRQQDRFLHWKHRTNQPTHPIAEVNTSMANMHVVPANDAVAAQLDQLPVGAVISLKGELVQARATLGAQFHIWKSSTARNDTGTGACEVVLVRELTVRLPPAVVQKAK